MSFLYSFSPEVREERWRTEQYPDSAKPPPPTMSLLQGWCWPCSGWKTRKYFPEKKANKQPEEGGGKNEVAPQESRQQCSHDAPTLTAKSYNKQRLLPTVQPWFLLEMVHLTKLLFERQT